MCTKNTIIYFLKSCHAGADTFFSSNISSCILLLHPYQPPLKKTTKTQTDKKKYTETFGNFSSLLYFEHTSFLSFFFTCFYCEFGKPTR